MDDAPHLLAARDAESAVARLPAELSIVIPTLNEEANVGELLLRLDVVLYGIAWEAIFVDDDSQDQTVARLRSLALRDPRVRCIHRIGRRGLSTACIEGILASSAPVCAVMDADLQHDETLLPKMLKTLREENLDLVVGSRYVDGGGLGEWSADRAAISGFATKLSRLIIDTDLKDPMSGFFMIRRDSFEGAVRRLSGQGFKILLDLFASSPRPLRFRELPFEFRQRIHGQSKLDAMVAWEYIMLIADKLVGRWIPVRLLMFCLVGGLGLLVHLTVLASSLKLLGLGFTVAQTAATLTAMFSNFTLNNIFTYRDRRLKGWGFVKGLISFSLVCGLGAVANVGAASVIYGEHQAWWVAGVAGAIVGSVWNYAVSSVFTWKKK